MTERKLPAGVYKRFRKFMAQISVDGCNVYIGLFDTPECALKSITDYRKHHGIEAPKVGRPKKVR